MIEDYIPEPSPKQIQQALIPKASRDSFTVYSGLRGTFIQAYKLQLDEKAQIIATNMHGAKLPKAAISAEREELIISQEKAKLLIQKMQKPHKHGDISSLVYSKDELKFMISKLKLIQLDIQLL
jgi:hypothetical protein